VLTTKRACYAGDARSARFVLSVVVGEDERAEIARAGYAEAAGDGHVSAHQFQRADDSRK
jgi:hypothetical protein